MVRASQLESKLKKWKFRKNLKKREWVAIDHEIQKRKRDDKDSEVVLCGKRLKKVTVDKETARHRDKAVCAQISLEESALPLKLIDYHVAVCTPQLLNDLFRTTSPKAIESRANVAHIGVTKLSAIIGRLMLESYPQENLQRAQNILAGSSDEITCEYMSMLIYHVSNNIPIPKDGVFKDNGEREWGITLITLERYGLFRLNIDLCSVRGPTVDAFIVNLFDVATERYLRLIGYKSENHSAEIYAAEAAINWVVTSAYCPSACATVLWSNFGYLHDPKEGKRGSWVMELTRRLLKSGADADLLLSFISSDAIMSFPFEFGDDSLDLLCDLFQCLLNFGASKNLERALHIALMGCNKDLTERIIHIGADPAAKLEPLLGSFTMLHKETALTISAAKCTAQTRYTLNLLSVKYPYASLADFITPDAFIAAAGAECHRTLRLFYSISKEITANENGITPLVVAASEGSLSICRLLLELQPTCIQSTTHALSPLHMATFLGHEHIVQFLITSGADVNAVAKIENPKVISWIEEQTSFYFPIRKRIELTPLEAAVGMFNDSDGRLREYSYHPLSCAALLIRGGSELIGGEVYTAAFCGHLELLTAALGAGADPNEMDATGTKSALQGALVRVIPKMKDQRDVVSLLLSKGAKLLGGEVVSAISLKNWEVVQLLLEHGSTLLDKQVSGKTALEQAIQSKDKFAIKKIFELEPSVYSAGALYAAIAGKNDQIIRQLIKNRPSLGSTDPLEITSLAAVAQSGDLDLLRDLLAHRPTCRVGPMPKELHRAYHPFQKYYYQDVGDIYKKTCLHGSPLTLVAQETSAQASEACSELLRSGYCADKLTWAMVAFSNNIAFARTLLDHGQYCHPDEHIINPLHGAIDHNNIEMMDLLIEAGVDVNDGGGCPLFPIQLAVSSGKLDLVKLLVQDGADVNLINTTKEQVRSALQTAVEQGRSDIMEYLIQSGADINCRPSNNGCATALQLAAIKGYLGIAKYLLDLGAQINAPPAYLNGRTALQGAAEHGKLDMLEFLLSNGALTTGHPWRRRFVVAVKMAINQNHFAVADLLKQRAGWSEQDEKLMLRVDIRQDHDGIDEEIEISDEELDDSSDIEDETLSNIHVAINQSREQRDCSSNTGDVGDARVEHDVVFGASSHEEFDFDSFLSLGLGNVDFNIGSNRNEEFVFEEEHGNGFVIGIETVKNLSLAIPIHKALILESNMRQLLVR
ncbi:hypothetical protein NPX13_g470 [Xylaria arbuscula]|uniref:Uncharacterized protein n=1 Tax=Xylaria arbuscula TaxID=114810 RepID=A0A9W8NP63_9PEZI|nr:hypothetical protein NPX13_g470 [Xylaria arbuscula]